MIEIAPHVGHEMNEPHIRGRVYDAIAGRVLDREETLAAFDRGELTATSTQHKNVRPSYHTRQATGGGVYMDASGRAVTLTRDELVTLFDAADTIFARLLAK